MLLRSRIIERILINRPLALLARHTQTDADICRGKITAETNSRHFTKSFGYLPGKHAGLARANMVSAHRLRVSAYVCG